MNATQSQIGRLLRPRSIALVGASATPGSLGESVFLNLKNAAFGGDLYLINPKRPLIHGHASLGSISEMPDGVDCAVLAIPAGAVSNPPAPARESRSRASSSFPPDLQRVARPAATRSRNSRR